MHRLFLALSVPRPLADELEKTQNGVDRIRWVPRENLHCTLRFIGEVERHVAADIVDALAGFSGRTVAYHVDGVGIFDNQSRGQLWARLAPKEPLAALHAKLDRLLQRCGLRPEGRAYLPHITLGRWSGGFVDATHWAAQHAGLTSPDVTAGCVTLYESQLGRHGPTYQALADYRLS